MRGIDSEALCGKTTVMAKSIEEYLEKTKKLPGHLSKDILVKLDEAIVNHQVCLIFTNKDIGEITKITDQFKVEKQSKVGASSPVEITLPAGPTGMDASQVDYFQNLRIQTRVVKNQLEIINPTKILTVGQKITRSEINLMNKINIKPFKHVIQINNIIMGGRMYDSGILNVNNESMEKAVLKGISNIAAFGLATGISNKASAPHSIAHAFGNILGLSLGCDVEIKQAKGLKAAVVEAPVKTEVKKEEKKPEKKVEKKKVEEDEDDMPMGLF